MKKLIDWADIAAIFVSVFTATTVKHVLFMDKLVNYSIWADLLLYLAVFLPVYLLMRFLLKKK